MGNKLYLTELIKQRGVEIQKNRINLIHAYCGSGKSSYVFNHLINQYPEKRRIFYLVDTLMLQESIFSKYEDENANDKVLELAEYNKDEVEKLFSSNEWGENSPETSMQKITIMSYNKFGLIIKNKPQIIDELDLIILDEGHNLVNYSMFTGDKVKQIADKGTNENDIYNAMRFISNTGRLLYALPSICLKCDVVVLTATPRKILEHEILKPHIRDILGQHKKDLKRYTEKKRFPFAHIDNIYDKFLNVDQFRGMNAKILIYTDTIDSSLEIKKRISEKGYNVECLWSTSNTRRTMNREQIELRDYIIKNNELPKDIEVLILNNAYSTGWDLHDKDKLIDVVICNSSNWDTITQFRGRVRHDISALYYRSGDSTYEDIKINEKWLDRNLTTDDKKELAEELNVKNKDGKNIKWTSIKKKLIEQSYKVTDRKITLKGSRILVSCIESRCPQKNVRIGKRT